jgi:hypothetical protein
MAFGLPPKDYLGVVGQQHVEFKADSLSLVKAIGLAILANHICEHVFAAYGRNEASKVGGCKNVGSYRKYLESLKVELAFVRDLCDFAKHGPVLSRKNVRVEKVQAKETMVAEYQGLLLALTNHHEEQKIVITLDDGSERHFDYLLEDVMRFWKSQFEAKDL